LSQAADKIKMLFSIKAASDDRKKKVTPSNPPRLASSAPCIRGGGGKETNPIILKKTGAGTLEHKACEICKLPGRMSNHACRYPMPSGRCVIEGDEENRICGKFFCIVCAGEEENRTRCPCHIRKTMGSPRSSVGASSRAKEAGGAAPPVAAHCPPASPPAAPYKEIFEPDYCQVQKCIDILDDEKLKKEIYCFGSDTYYEEEGCRAASLPGYALLNYQTKVQTPSESVSTDERVRVATIWLRQKEKNKCRERWNIAFDLQKLQKKAQDCTCSRNKDTRSDSCNKTDRVIEREQCNGKDIEYKTSKRRRVVESGDTPTLSSTSSTSSSSLNEQCDTSLARAAEALLTLLKQLLKAQEEPSSSSAVVPLPLSILASSSASSPSLALSSASSAPFLPSSSKPTSKNKRQLPTSIPHTIQSAIEQQKNRKSKKQRGCSCTCAFKGCKNRYIPGGGIKFNRIPGPAKKIPPDHKNAKLRDIKTYYAKQLHHKAFLKALGLKPSDWPQTTTGLRICHQHKITQVEKKKKIIRHNQKELLFSYKFDVPETVGLKSTVNPIELDKSRKQSTAKDRCHLRALDQQHKEMREEYGEKAANALMEKHILLVQKFE